MGEFYKPSNVVIITEYTTVYQTTAPGQTDAPSPSPASHLASTTMSSSRSQRSSEMSKATASPTSIFSATTPTNASATAIGPVPSASSETVSQDPKTSDTYAYVLLALVISLVVLLLTMIASMIYLRCRGKCPNCQSMQKKPDKGKSSEPKPTTTNSASKLEKSKKSASQANASAGLDVERGHTCGIKQARAAALSQLEANKEPSIWGKVKSKVSRDARPPPAGKRDPVDSGFEWSTYYEPTTHLRTPAAPGKTASSFRFETADTQRTDGNRRRVFADVPVSQPKHYRRDVTDEHGFNYTFTRENDIYMAEAARQTDDYKRAESIMKRASAPDSVIRRATSIVNFADQQLNIARNPYMYPEFRPS